jgi:hypothetical protein
MLCHDALKMMMKTMMKMMKTEDRDRDLTWAMPGPT